MVIWRNMVVCDSLFCLTCVELINAGIAPSHDISSALLIKASVAAY